MPDRIAIATRRQDFDEGRLASPAPDDFGEPMSGVVAMSNFGQNGRLGNQLLQYLFLRFYAMRNSLGIAMPEWPDGRALAIPPPVRNVRKGQLPIVRFAPFEDGAALALWNLHEPPSDVDFDGYFQEIPGSWIAYRKFARSVLQLTAEAEARISAWRSAVAPPGTTLVSIHVRRGDFADYDPAIHPHFRMAPVEWYCAWLDRIWSKLERPRLFLASDDRAAVAPAFASYSPLPAPDTGLNSAFDDLAGLRSADVLGLCNSSFSRSAALMADDAQRQAIVDFEHRDLVDYRAWADRSFWARFGPVPPTLSGDIDRRIEEARREHALRPWRRLARRLPLVGPALLAARMRLE